MRCATPKSPGDTVKERMPREPLRRSVGETRNRSEGVASTCSTNDTCVWSFGHGTVGMLTQRNPRTPPCGEQRWSHQEQVRGGSVHLQHKRHLIPSASNVVIDLQQKRIYHPRTPSIDLQQKRHLRVSGSGFRVSGVRVQGFGFRGFGFRVSSFGVSVSG